MKKALLVSGVLLTVLGSARLHALPPAQVYVGGGDEHRGAFDGYLADPAGWAWVRQNADGYYLNTFPLKSTPAEPTQSQHLRDMAALFAHKNIFYETEAESYAHRVHDADDQARITLLQQAGFAVTYITCNGSFTDERTTLLKNWSGKRPLFALMGPWAIGGDIANPTNPKAAQWRTLIDKTDGSATDSPLAAWADDKNGCRNGSYSGVKYAHAHGKLAEVMLCPHKLGTNENWLAMSEQYVRDHEDNDAFPDLWAVSYYAAYLEAHAVTPEQVNGAPAASVTGVAYYLIHHLRDNDHAAKLSASAPLLLNAPTQTVQVVLNNGSAWLDLIPVVKAQVSDVGSAWNVAFFYEGRDITAAVRNANGFCFYKVDRLNPGGSKTISVTVSSKTGQVSHAPLGVTLQLLPHPTTPVVSQTVQLLSPR